MASNYASVNEAKEKLTAAINKALSERGVSTHTTCPTGEPFGWDMLAHYALKGLQRNPPVGWHMEMVYRHECCEWTITEK